MSGSLDTAIPLKYSARYEGSDVVCRPEDEPERMKPESDVNLSLRNENPFRASLDSCEISVTSVTIL